MKFKVSAGCFKCKIFKNPTRKLTHMLKKFKLKKSLCIRPLCFRTSEPKPKSTNSINSNSISSPARKKKLISRLKSVLFCSKQTVDMDRLMKLKSFSDSGQQQQQQQKAPNSSPITPAYVRTSAAAAAAAACLKSEVDPPPVVEDACRSFESYLVEMIVEEGKLNDLMDVEELLYCWMNLKCPIFKELVSRFYGDLCKDMFSNDNV